MKTIIYAGVYFIVSTTGQLPKFQTHFKKNILFELKKKIKLGNEQYFMGNKTETVQPSLKRK
jgi:hypothetical protein